MVFLVLAAAIWGMAFVAQRKSSDAIGPFTFNGIRSLLGGVVLLPVIALLDRAGLSGKKSRVSHCLLHSVSTGVWTFPRTKEQLQDLGWRGACGSGTLFSLYE